MIIQFLDPWGTCLNSINPVQALVAAGSRKGLAGLRSPTKMV